MTTNLDTDTLKWAAQWIQDSLKGEADERVIKFGNNMAMTLRAAVQPAASTPTEGLTFHDAVRIARGCTDYGGGHHYDGKMDAYQHGIKTVITALEHVEKNGLNGLQNRTLHTIGATSTEDK